MGLTVKFDPDRAPARDLFQLAHEETIGAALAGGLLEGKARALKG
jgi:hypothetical protein